MYCCMILRKIFVNVRYDNGCQTKQILDCYYLFHYRKIEDSVIVWFAVGAVPYGHKETHIYTLNSERERIAGIFQATYSNAFSNENCCTLFTN